MWSWFIKIQILKLAGHICSSNLFLIMVQIWLKILHSKVLARNHLISTWTIIVVVVQDRQGWSLTDIDWCKPRTNYACWYSLLNFKMTVKTYISLELQKRALNSDVSNPCRVRSQTEKSADQLEKNLAVAASVAVFTRWNDWKLLNWSVLFLLFTVPPPESVTLSYMFGSVRVCLRERRAVAKNVVTAVFATKWGRTFFCVCGSTRTLLTLFCSVQSKILRGNHWFFFHQKFVFSDRKHRVHVFHLASTNAENLMGGWWCFGLTVLSIVQFIRIPCCTFA